MPGYDEGALRERLLAGLDEAAGRLERLAGQPLGEQDTKVALVSPVLRALGWQVEDIEQVRHEYRHRSSDKPVDYALLLARVPQLFVEAKGFGERLKDRRWAGQVVSYAAVAGVGWVALTDGDEWRLFNAHAPVDVDEKLFRSVRISEDRLAAAEALGYLARETIARSQHALATLWEAERADRAVRQTIERLFNDEPADWFVSAIARRLDGLTRGQIKAALERIQVHLDTPPPAEVTEYGPTEEQVVRESPRPEAAEAGGRRDTLRDLIRAGIIQPPLSLTKRYLGRELHAEVQEDGTVVFDGKVFRTLSTAAAKARESVKGGPPPGRESWQTNGWAFWLFRDEKGNLQPVDVLRQEYRKRRSRQESR